MTTDAQIQSSIGDCRPLADLQGPDFEFVDLDRNIEAMAERIGFEASNTSALVVSQSNGEIDHVWTTDSARPFELQASYTRLQ